MRLLYKKFASNHNATSDTRCHTDEVARFLAAAKSTKIDVVRFRDSSDAQYPWVLLFQRTVLICKANSRTMAEMGASR